MLARVALIVGSVVALAACGGGASTQRSPDGSTPGPTAIGSGDVDTGVGIDGGALDTGSGSDLDAPADTAAPACPASAPAGGTCAVPQGCAYGSTCSFCAGANAVGPFDCATRGCTWGSMDIGAPDPNCPNGPPKDGTMCGSNRTCLYCTAQGLVSAECSAINDTYTWYVGLTPNQTRD